MLLLCIDTVLYVSYHLYVNLYLKLTAEKVICAICSIFIHSSGWHQRHLLLFLHLKGGNLNLWMRNEPEPLLDHVYQHKSQGDVKLIELTTKYQYHKCH